ncbi:MAG: putative tail fiber protein [Prokaryotic dsDNA virus sp.]|nr:MAG: putative tail fiber protein [Prokaryotic dsDNA virus sp.]|tara:strand:- start:22447 stop:26484 length:4038 start_codon:yes stop_codon:yes gene_type:complete
MATLTNTQISVTYVGLLKTTGSTILDSTPQQITDGSGNNSQLFLSTAKVGIGATPSGSDTLQVQGSISITGDGSNATTLTESGSGDFTIDVAGDLSLDADGGDILFKDAGTTIGTFSNSSTDFVIQSNVSDKDIIFKGNDDGSTITALTLDMSAGGNATFAGDVTTSGEIKIIDSSATGNPKLSFHQTTNERAYIQYADTGEKLIIDSDADLVLNTNNTTRLTIDSNGVSTFGGNVGIGITSPSEKLEVGGPIVWNGSLIASQTSSGVLDRSGDNIRIRAYGASAGSGVLQIRTGGGGDDVDTLALTIDSSQNATFAGDISISVAKKLYFGGGSHTYISEDIDDRLRFFTGGTEFMRFTEDTSDIINFYTDATFAGDLNVLDSNTLNIGTGNDLKINHNGTDSFIINETGNLKITQGANDSDIIFESDDGSNGVAEYFRVDGGDTSIIFSKTIKQADSKYISLGDSFDFHFIHNGTSSVITNSTGNLEITNDANDKDIIFNCDDGSDGTTEYFRLDGSKGGQGGGRLFTKFPDNSTIAFGGDSLGDLQIYHDASNSYIDQVGTGDLYIRNNVDNKDIHFQSDDGSGGLTDYIKLDGTYGLTQVAKTMQFIDSVKLLFGNSVQLTGDLQIYHDGSNSYIDQVGTGDLIIQQSIDDKDIIFKSDDGSSGTTEYFKVDGGAEQVIFSKEIKLLDSVLLKIGGGGDLRLSHNGTNSFITNNTGDLTITNNTNDGDIIFKSDDGSDGTTEYFKLDGGDTEVIVSKAFTFLDNVKAKFGGGNDLQIYHDGSNSYINESGTGVLSIQSDGTEVQINKGASEYMARFITDAGVKLYYDNSLKFETTSSGVEVSGDITLNPTSTSNNAAPHKLVFKGTDYQGNTDTYGEIGFEDDGSLTQDGSSFYIKGNSDSGSLYNIMTSDGYGQITFGSNVSGVATLTCTGINTGQGTNEVYAMDQNVRTTDDVTFDDITATGIVNLANLKVSGAQGSDGQVLTSTGSGVAWEDASGGGGGASSLNGLSDVTIDGTSAYFINIPSGLSGNPANNLVIGDNAGNALTDGNSNVIIGHDAGDAITTGDFNVCLGVDAGTGHTTNSRSVYIGYQAGKLVNASSSVVIGERALDALSGAYNQHTVIGSQACTSTSSGNHQVAFGYQALNSQTSGNKNTAVGYESLEDVTTGDHNTALGYEAGDQVTGEQNTLIGGSAGSSGTNDLTSGDNNTIIGYNAAASSATVNNEITLGNSSIATLRCQVTSITALSDKRDKENIQPSNYGLDVVDKLKPVTFDWNTRDGAKVGQKDLGFIAQDLQEVDDENLKLVYDNNPEKLEASYGRLVPVLVKAIQELKAEIELLKSK